MKSRASAPRPSRDPDPREPAALTVRQRLGARIRRGIARISAPSFKEAERRIRSTPTLLETLTPEDLAALRELEPTGPLTGRSPDRRGDRSGA